MRRRAAAHGRSAEAEHQEILTEVPDADTLKTGPLSIPDAGDDAEVGRPNDTPRDIDL